MSGHWTDDDWVQAFWDELTAVHEPNPWTPMWKPGWRQSQLALFGDAEH